MYLLSFIGGMMFGGTIGVFFMAACIVSGNESYKEEQNKSISNKRNVND